MGDFNSSAGPINSTQVLLTTSTSPARQQVSSTMVAVVGLLVDGIGTCANAGVLAVLVRARRQFSSSVHTLISHQCGMDLFTCVSAMVNLVYLLAHGYTYTGERVLDDVLCLIFEGGIMIAVGVTAGIIGLMVITLERYFKIVHAIGHRKYYRSWMTSAGVALPWIGGVSIILFPSIGTTRVVNGRCIRFGMWPNQAMAKGFAVMRFLWHYAIPVTVFAYCYGRIFYVIRRKNKVTTANVVTMATAGSRDQGTGQAFQPQETGGKLSRTELKVLQTMIVVIALFVISWATPAFTNLLQPLQIVDVSYNVFVLSGSLAFVTLSINPFIYAARYPVLRQYVTQLMKKTGVAPSNADGTRDATQSTNVNPIE